MEPDYMLTNARVYTVDSSFATAEAVAVTRDRFAFVGSDEGARRLAGPRTRTIDLGGRTVVPGFMDCHLHPIYAAKNFSQVQLLGVTSIADILARIKDRVQELPAGAWLRGSNHWSLDIVEEGRLPYRSELDQAAPEHPFWLNVAFHRGAANSLALQAAGIGAETPENWGTGYVFKDPDTGEPNGHLLEAALFATMATMYGHAPETPEQIVQGIQQVEDLLLSHGITSVIDQGDVGPPFVNFKLLQRVWQDGGLRVRWRVNHIGFEMADMPIEEIDDHIGTLRTVSGYGDEWLRMGAIGELVLDGFVEDALTREPYAEDVFGSGWCGIQLFKPETVLAICRAAARHGLQMNVHCSGDAALDLALDSFEQVHREIPIHERRWTLEHGGLHPSDRNLEQCREMGVVVSTQQPLQYWHAKDILRYLGRHAEDYFPNRTWLDNGVPLRGGSDFDTAPLSPLLGMWTAVTRKTITGDVIGPGQALTRQEALRLYTSDAAASVFEDADRGSIEAGKLADLVVLSGDPMAVAEDDIKDISVEATVVGGTIAHDPNGVLRPAA